MIYFHFFLFFFYTRIRRGLPPQKKTPHSNVIIKGEGYPPKTHSPLQCHHKRRRGVGGQAKKGGVGWGGVVVVLPHKQQQ